MSQSEQPTSSTQNNSTLEDRVTQAVNQKLLGQVKWFHNRLNYGFITVVSRDYIESNGPADVFVHQSHIHPLKSSYRTLYQGEYVSFDLTSANAETGEASGHSHQAVNVTGVEGGNLMCDISPRRSDTRRRTQPRNSRDSRDTRDSRRGQYFNQNDNNTTTDNTNADNTTTDNTTTDNTTTDNTTTNEST